MLFLVEGEYTFRAEKPGYNSLFKTVNITQATSITLEMIPSGILLVSASPEDAQITINEQSKSTGTFEGELPVGKHYVQVQREGFIPRVFYVEVKQYSKKTLEVSLEKEGKTKIVSDPSNALISVDGSKIGYTPLETHLKPGKHIIAFHKDWYYSETKDIFVKSDSLNEFTQILKPFSNITIQASPANTLIEFDGSKASAMPLTLKEIDPGEYYVSYSAQGYKTIGKTVYLDIGENSVFEELSLKEYTWTVESTPSAVVILDGKESGITPVDLKVTHGEHTLHLNSADKEWMTKIESFDNGKTSVNLNLETTVLFDVIPAGQSFIIHKGKEYETPAIINTTEGLQTFDIVRGGYPSRRRLFKLLPGKIYEQSVNLEGESELFLVSKPSGAKVFWMGAYIGITPLRGVKIRPGAGQLRLEWFDAKYEEKSVFLDGETYTVYREIPSQTKVTINSLPMGLEVSLDGKDSGITPLIILLKQGSYTLRCTDSQGVFKEEVIKLDGEKERTINFVF